MTNEEIFNNNVNIAYKIANRYMSNYYDEIEDIRQIALMELWRCVEDWDHIHALTTYAYIRIPSKINIYLRYLRKHEKNISINTIIHEDSKSCFTLEDYLEDPNDYIGYLLDDINAEGVLEKIKTNDIEKEVIRLRMTGLSQKDVGDILGLSQAQISRYQRKIKDKISDIINGRSDTGCQEIQPYLMR